MSVAALTHRTMADLPELIVFGKVEDMKVTIQKQPQQEMRRASEVMGVSEEELTERAMRFYLASIHQELELEKEKVFQSC